MLLICNVNFCFFIFFLRTMGPWFMVAYTDLFFTLVKYERVL